MQKKTKCRTDKAIEQPLLKLIPEYTIEEVNTNCIQIEEDCYLITQDEPMGWQDGHSSATGTVREIIKDPLIPDTRDLQFR